MRLGIERVRNAKLREKLLASSLGLCLSSTGTATWADSATDLSSRTRDNVAGAAGTIKVGTSVKTITPGDLLTDAEQLALHQVLAGGSQTLLLSAFGTARGGTFQIDNIASNLSSLVVPRGVTALQNIGQSDLNISGTLSNSGRIFFYSNNPSTLTANIAAQNIFNNSGGLLSTAVPASLLNGLTVNPQLNLNLSAIQNIINAGIIRSAGNLNLTAGGSIINSGVIQASNNLNLISNSISNSNLINAAGNLNLSSLNTGSISVNNVNGTLQALLINIRDSLFNTKSDFTLTGGNLRCDALNINSGTGTARINVNDLIGVVNVNAGEVHVSTKTANLNLGTLNISGDPTFYNQAGNIDFTNSFNFTGESLAIVAKGNITANGDNLSINTGSATGNGGAISLVAGANFTLINPASSSPFPGEADAATTLKITGGSSTGGKIDFNVASDKDIAQLSSASTFVGASGGDIKLIAFKGTGANSGTINLPNTLSIDSSGASSGKNGNLLIIANSISTSANAISIGSINANGTGSMPNTGNVEIYGATPIVGSGVSITDGTISSGSFLPGAFTKTSIVVNNSSDVGGSFISKTAGNTVFSDIKAGGDVRLTAGSTPVTKAAGLIVSDINSAGNVSLTTTGTAVGIGFSGPSQLGTVSGNNVSLNASGGNIELNYSVISGGTLTASTSGTGSIKLNNQSASDSLIGASSAPGNSFQIESVNSISTTGIINSPGVVLHTSSPSANITLGSTVGKSGASVELSVSGTGSITQTAGNVIGKTLTLKAASGDIGSSGSPLNSIASNISATTSGAVVNINNTGTLAINASASGDLFKLVNTGDITVAKDGGIISPRVELETQKNIILAAQVGSSSSTGNNINLTAASISQTAGNFRILGGDVFLSLSSSNGSIGSLTLPIRTTALGLGMVSSASAYANNSGNLNVLNSVAFSGTYKLVNDGNVTVTQLLQSGPVIDIQTLNNGNIIVASRLGGTNSGQVNLSAAGSGTITTVDPPGPIPGTIEGLTVTLKSSSGNFGSQATHLQTSAINLILNTTGDAFINWAPNTNSVSTLFGYALSLKTSSLRDLTLSANGPVIVAGSLNAQNVSINTYNDGVLLPDLTRDITLKANIGTSAIGTSSLTASNTGNKTSFGSADIVEIAGTILSAAAVLVSENENIGSSKTPIFTASKTLSATTSGNGSVFISNTGNLSLLNASSPNGTFSLLTTGTLIDPGNITVDAPVTSVKDFVLQTKANNASIILNGHSIAATNITLNANGTGNITDQVGNSALSADNNINLISGKGNIGSLNSRLQIANGTVFAKTTAAGAVFLNFQNSASISNSSAGSQFDLTTSANASNITIAGELNSPIIHISADGDIVASSNSKQTLNSAIELSLSSQTGNIGSVGTPVLTKAKSLSVLSSDGSAYIRNSGALTLNTSATDNASNDSLLSIENVGTTIIAGKLSADGAVIIASTSTLTQSNSSSGIAITGPTVSLTSAVAASATSSSNFGTALARIQIDTANLNTNTKGNVFVNNVGSTGNVNVNAFSGNGFDITSTSGNITINGALTNPVLNVAAKGDVLIAATAGKVSGKTSISAANIVRVNSATVVGATILLSTASGDIGASGLNNDILIDTPNLIVNQSGGNAFISDKIAGAINISPDKASSSTIFVLTNNGNIVVKAPLLASTSIALNSAGGALTTSGSGMLKAPSINLGGVGQTGNLGTDLAAVKLSANVVSAVTDKGSVNLLNSGSSSLSIVGSQSGQSFKVSDNTGSLSIDGAIKLGQSTDLAKKTNNLSLLQTAAAGTIAVNGNLDVTGGSILINATDAGGKITFANGVSVNTLVDLATPVSNGVIKIAIGKVPTTVTNQLSSSGNFVVSNTAPGLVYAGVNPNALLATGAQVVPIALNAKGRNVIFNSASSNSIQFGDNVNITADPPGAGLLNGVRVSSQMPPEIRSLYNRFGNATTAQFKSAVQLNQQQLFANREQLFFDKQQAFTSNNEPTFSNNQQGFSNNQQEFSNNQQAFSSSKQQASSIDDQRISYINNQQISYSDTRSFAVENTLASTAKRHTASLSTSISETGLLVGNISCNGYTTPINEQKTIGLRIGNAGEGSTNSKQHDRHLVMKPGVMLFAPTKDLVVMTQIGELRVRAGAAVIAALQEPGVLSVFTLHDKKYGDVSISSKLQRIILGPGQHATIAERQITDFSQVNMIDCVAHRNVQSVHNHSLTVFTSEFSIVSALAGFKTIGELRNSSISTHRKLADQCLKNAAVLFQIAGKKGQYQQIKKSETPIAMH